MATQASSQSSSIPASSMGGPLVGPADRGDGLSSGLAAEARAALLPPAAWKVAAAWLGLGSLTVAAALVFWLFDALPFQDLPAHAGLIALRHRFASSPFEQRFYVLAPHLGPYSLFRSLGDLLVVPFGPVAAIRIIATLPLVVTPYVLLWARRRLHGDRSMAAAYFGLTLGFGFMTLLGFASYLLGVAVFIVALTVWLELMVAADQGPPLSVVAFRHEIAIALIAPCLFLAHGHAFLIFLGMAGVCAVATGNRFRRVLRARALVPALALAAWVAWRERASVVPAGSVPPHQAIFAPHFQGAYDKLSLLITPTLFTRTGIDAVLGVFVWVVVMLGVVATGRSLRGPAMPPGSAEASSRAHSRALLASLAVLAAVFLVLPHSIGWFGFVDGRLVPLLLLLGLLAIRRPALGPLLGSAFERGAPFAACGMVAIALGASALFQKEASGWHEVLDTIPANARVLNLPIDPNSTIFTAHPFVHYDKLVLTERPGVVSDVWFHQGSAIYPTAENPALRLPDTYSESDLRFIDWPAYDLADWDYVLIRTRTGAPEPRVPDALSLAIHKGGWWLYRHGPLASAPPRP